MPRSIPGRDVLAWQLRNTYDLATRQVEVRIQQGLQAAGVRDIRPVHFRVFEFLPADGIRLTDLARNAQVTKQSMGQLVDHLETCGYLERIADRNDGRANIIRRTARGWELEAIAIKAVAEQDAIWRTALGEEWYASTRHALEVLEAEIEARQDES